MPDKIPTTETMKISDVRAELNKLVNRVYRHETRVIVEKSGIPVAAVVSTDDLDRLNQLDEEDRSLWSIVDEMREAFKDVPPEDIEREAERTLAGVRAEMRAERVQFAAET